ncbi:integrator complex subunit 9-like [Schistocerca gregaria]|uniref:integrator complex subunit 9-like n=1 Tax=Schistocerca gregaria TaxID=7010 RepID=UPI00211DFF6D|nr:integrator complex subunit 9-like [Schistocerca gregaria]
MHKKTKKKPSVMIRQNALYTQTNSHQTTPTMRLHVLDSVPNASCYLLEIRGVSILIDCGAECWRGEDGHFPELGGGSRSSSPTRLRVSSIDASAIDVVLISNFHSLMALPHLTERGAFHGRVYATEPTVQLGKHLMFDLVDQAEDSPAGARNREDAAEWRHAYDKKSVSSCIGKIQTCVFDEQIELYEGVRVTALSSGYTLGSCNWIIESEYRKIGYVSHSSMATLSGVHTHAQPIELEALKDCDALIIAQLANPEIQTQDLQLANLCNHVGLTISEGGSVLLPIPHVMVVADLLDTLHQYLNSVGLHTIPICFISPICDFVFQYLNISAEWLEKSKQTRVYMPANPFSHLQLIEAGSLLKFDSVKDPKFTACLKKPCIFLASDSSMRAGDAVHLLHSLKNDPKNAVVVIDPGVTDVRRCLVPFEPYQLKVHVCHLDPRLLVSEAALLIETWRPRRLVLPSARSASFQLLQTRAASDYPDIEVYTIDEDYLELSIKRRYDRVYIQYELAKTIRPKPVHGCTRMAAIKATLAQHDGETVLKPSATSSIPSVESHSPLHSALCWGQPIPSSVFAELQRHDRVRHLSIHYENTPSQEPIVFIRASSPSPAIISFSPTSTTIRTDDQETRAWLATILLKQLCLVL